MQATVKIDLKSERAAWRARRGVPDADYTEWIRIGEAIERTEYSAYWLRNLARKSLVRAKKRSNRMWLFDAADLARYKAEQNKPPVRLPPRVCRVCKEEYPGSEFTRSGTSYGRDRTRRGGICNACFVERYPPTKARPCSACGGTIASRIPRDRPAYHRACRP